MAGVSPVVRPEQSPRLRGVLSLSKLTSGTVNTHLLSESEAPLASCLGNRSGGQIVRLAVLSGVCES